MSYNRYDLTIPKSKSMFAEPTLEYISSSRYEGDWKSTPHSHNCTELFYVVSGEGTFQADSETFLVSAEDIVIVNPGIEHSENALQNEPLEYIVLGIGNEVTFIPEKNGYLKFSAKDINEDFSFYLQEILKEAENDTSYTKIITQFFLNLIIAKLLRNQKVVCVENEIPSKNLESLQIKRYIDHHFSEDITLDTLAKVAHLNKYYLVHTFTKENKISPINYLIQCRLKESKYLLTDTNYSIAEIAQHTGFSSSSYFSQVFNKAEKISPRQYRQQNSK